MVSTFRQESGWKWGGGTAQMHFSHRGLYLDFQPSLNFPTQLKWHLSSHPNIMKAQLLLEYHKHWQSKLWPSKNKRRVKCTFERENDRSCVLFRTWARNDNYEIAIVPPQLPVAAQVQSLHQLLATQEIQRSREVELIRRRGRTCRGLCSAALREGEALPKVTLSLKIYFPIHTHSMGIQYQYWYWTAGSAMTLLACTEVPDIFYI